MDATEVPAAQRLDAQLLTRPAGSPEQVVERLLAVQGQDARAFRLAVRARTRGCTSADVDAALNDGSLLVSWLCRGTLHLVRSSDYPWLHALTGPRIAPGNRRRLAELGLDPATTARSVELIGEALAAGPRTRDELRSVLDAAGVPTAGQRLVHLLVAASLRAHVVRGPMRGGEQCFVDARHWLGDVEAPDRDTCLARLGGRYLAGHGPAAARDLAAFAGITLTDARRALVLVADRTREVRPGLVSLGGHGPAPDLPPPRLLGMFDPVLHGWADRSFVTGAHGDVVTTNGMFRATTLVEGRVSGTWTLPRGVVTVSSLDELTSSVIADLEAEAADVLRFLGLPDAPMVVRSR